MSSQITLAAPRLGAEEGIGRTTKKNEHEKPLVPCLCLAARLPRPWPRTEWGGRRDGRKQTDEQKGTTPGPALSEGSVGQEKIKRTNQAAQPNHARDTPNPDIKIPKHLKEPKEKDEDLKTQKAPGTTQRENADPETQKRPGVTQGVNSNRNTQKVPEVIQGGEPREPENCRARRRRESQLITAAPLESSTLRWTPRENALAT